MNDVIKWMNNYFILSSHSLDYLINTLLIKTSLTFFFKKINNVLKVLIYEFYTLFRVVKIKIKKLFLKHKIL